MLKLSKKTPDSLTTHLQQFLTIDRTFSNYFVQLCMVLVQAQH